MLARISEIDDPSAGYRFEAFPIKRLPREKRRLIGIFRAHRNGGGSIEPVDRKQLRSWSIAKGDEGPAKDGDLVRFDLAKKGRFNVPQARVLESIGNPDDQRQISLIAVHSHGIPDDFPESVITESEALSRADAVRAAPTCATCRSSPSIRPTRATTTTPSTPSRTPTRANPGGWIVLVAIADVAHFVRPDTKLDREAQLRGNSVYFPDRVVPMLPERISNNLCSLREGENRACLVVRMIFDKDGNKRSHAFMRAMMRSAAKLSYQEAQAAIDGQPSDKAGPLLERVLKPLWAAYAAVAAARDKRQPLDLDLPERKILLDEKGRVAKVVTPERLAAHRLIEEFMIQANVAAAETLEQKHTPVVYRIHDQPSKEKLSSLRDFLDTLGMKLPQASTLKPGHFNGILARAKTLPVADLVNEVVLRSQSQAEYNIDNIGHFGLNLRRYAHFTSPIRRYADLLVHRALVKALRLGEGGLEEQRDRPPARGGAADLRCGAPRHGRRARDGRPPHRRASRRSHRRDVHRAHRRRHALGAVREAEGYRRRRLRAGVVAAQRLLQSRRGRSTRSSASARARPSGSATRWKCGWSRPSPRREPCVSRC